MTTSGNLGDGISCLPVLLQDAFHSPELHLQVVCNHFGCLAFLVLADNQLALLNADSHGGES